MDAPDLACMYVVEVGQVPAHTEPISTVALRGLGVALAYILVFLFIAWYALKRAQILE